MAGFDLEEKQIIIHTEGTISSRASDLVKSDFFEKIFTLYVQSLLEQDSALLDSIDENLETADGQDRLLSLLRALAETSLEQNINIPPTQARRKALHQFVEGLYDFWRAFDRFMVSHSEYGPQGHDQRPYRTFNATVERLSHLVRGLYRDICENITGDHPRIYRQIAAGCNVGIIAVNRDVKATATSGLKGIPFIRQVLINPPLIIDPPMNKRTGQFQRVSENPLTGLSLKKSEWLCYPAQVGPLVIFVYFHQRFIGLGCSMANLFELATDQQIAAGPDAVFVYGVESLPRFADMPTVFYDDDKHPPVGAIPAEDRFGYFGYVKKMVLTLHNIVMMKRGRMPFHGAMTRLRLRSGAAANVVLIGDTATGKSETLEAFRILGQEHIREMVIIADDMGSLAVSPQGKVLGYGTETGAFIRLDDLQKGYAFGQIDRAIIMNPHKVNARVILPVTTLDEVLHGYPLDFMLYTNNYEEVDDEHPIIERFKTPERGLYVFREGAAMAKGTTSSTGLVHSYFANIFGPTQYKEVHEKLAAQIFEAAFKSGVFVGQIRTRLGVPGYEGRGPEEVARALFEVIS